MAMETFWDYRLIALSIIIAMIGSYIALDFAGRMKLARGSARKLWFIAGALTMGMAIWTMHFVGMLALIMPMPVTYDEILSALSILAATTGSGIAFSLVNRQSMGRLHWITGSVAMGLAIVTMHYTGMASMQMENTSIHYHTGLFALSVVIAISASGGALWLAFHLKQERPDQWFYQKVVSALVMGCAIAGMHYTGMAAAHYLHTGGNSMIAPLSTAPTVGIFHLSDLLMVAGAVFGMALLLLGAQATAERQRALEALRKSEERYELVIEGSNDGLWDWDHRTNVIYWNKRCYDQVGLPYDRVITPDVFISLIHPDDRERSLRIIQAHFERDEPYEIEFRLRHTSGEYGYFLARGKTVRDGRGNPLRTSGVRTDISILKRAEQSITESESRFRTMADASPLMIWMTEPDGHISYYNKTALKFIGQSTLQEAVEAGWQSFVHPDDLPMTAQRLQEAMEQHDSFELECRVKHADGHYHWVMTNLAPRHSPDHTLLGFVGSAMDITSRKQVEDALKQSLKDVTDIKNALDASTIVAITDKKGDITYVNDAFCRISKYSAEELLGQNHRIINSGHHPHEFFVEMWRHISRGQVWKGEIKNRAKDGTFYWVDTTIVPYLDDQGKPYQYVAIRHDITLQKRIEEELRTSLKDVADIKNALDQSTIVAITDKKGDITYVNDAFCRISKYSAEELLGQNHRIINSGYHPHEFFVTMWRHISRGQVWKGEIKNRAKDGTFYWVDTTIVPYLDDQGKPYQYVAIRHDITARKELELQLAEAKQVAEVANEKKSQFLANMSHELRTPLNAVIGYSEMMIKGLSGDLNEKQEKYTHAIAFSGHHLLDMVNDILDLSKIEAGKMQLACDHVELAPLFQELLDVFNVQAEKKQVQLALDIEPGLDGMTADPARLKQMFFNLINNAVKFNKDGGQVHIRLFKTEDRQWVVCEVRDTGIGIPKEKMSELFSEFYQVNNTMARQHEGTGLGLALTKRLVELHGGTISVESEEGVGSTFTFRLPATAPCPPNPESSEWDKTASLSP